MISGHRLNSLAIPAVLLAICVPGCSRPPGATGADRKPIPPVRVMTVSLTQQAARRTTAQPATVHAYHEAAIRPRVAGYLSSVNADIGDVVKAGQTLATIDVPELQQQTVILEAKIAQHKAQETSVKAGVTLAQASVAAASARQEQARSELQSVEASLAAAVAEFNRTQDLVDRRSLEARVLDEVQKKRDSERARRSSVQSAVTSAVADVEVAKAQLASAQARVAAAEAETEVVRQQLKELQVNLAFATLRAPFDGVVTHRMAEPGNLVQQDTTQQPLFVISRIDRVRVHVAVPERDAAWVNRGDEVTLTFPSFAQQEAITASVSRTTSRLATETRMMTVELELDNADGRLLPGMFGRAEITLAVDEQMAALPARAVRFTENGDAYVYVVRDGAVSRVDVVTGADDGQTIQIASGLSAEQTVIDAHLQRFQDGQQVDVLN